MQVRLLGPVDVTVAGSVRPMSGLRRKTLLAVLALHRGETVGRDRLIEIVWGDQPPATAVKTLQNQVAYLRAVLDDNTAIVARGHGYLLALPATAIDLGQVEALLDRGGQTADPAARADRLRAARDLWRGPSLSEVAGTEWLLAQTTRLEDLRLRVTHELAEVRLALGEHAQLVGELERLTDEHPYREAIHGQLMLALYRSGRQSDALAAYRRLRHTVIEDLGVDPGPALRDLEAAILRQDRSLDLAPPTATTTHATPAPAPARLPGAVPAQLPLTTRTFAGRSAELARLDALLATSVTDAEPAVSIAVVCGTAGVGKSALAVHWAHTVADRFPDGQLYVNLRGFDPGGAALEPADVIHGFMSALNPTVEKQPASLDERSALYRSTLADKRVLILLDNARDAEQVRAMLPGSAGCLVVVTSRDRLAGLVAIEGAHPISLELPSMVDAREILTRRVGAARAAAEPDAVDDIVTRCARLPLALAVAAARASYSTLPLSALADELRRAAALDPFQGSDLASDVRAVFSSSYQALSAESARLFRLLGLCPSPTVSVDAAASLAGLPRADVRSVLADLTQGHLINEPRPGWYALHDLLRAYATELAIGRDGETERSAALGRVRDHYLYTAYAGVRLLDANRDPLTLDPPRPGVTVTGLADVDQATAWFEAEQATLLAAVNRDEPGADWPKWQLAWSLFTILDRRNQWEESITALRSALVAAERTGDRQGQAYAHRLLGFVNVRVGKVDDADRHYEIALQLFTALGDHLAAANIQSGFGWTAEQRGDYPEALVRLEHALTHYEAAGHRVGKAHIFNGMAWCHSQLGRHDTALPYAEEALAIFVELGESDGRAGTLDTLGFLLLRLGEIKRGKAMYGQSIVAYQSIGDEHRAGETCVRLGDDLAAVGEISAARAAWKRALTIFGPIEHPDAAAVRTKLDTTPPPDPIG